MAKVLIIEDDEVAANILRKQLQGDRHEVVWSQDGLEGLKAAQENRPDFVILDYNLPSANGVTVLNKLRNDPTTASIPVVLVSAMAEKDVIGKLRRHFMGVTFLQKPLDFKRIQALIAAKKS